MTITLSLPYDLSPEHWVAVDRVFRWRDSQRWPRREPGFMDEDEAEGFTRQFGGWHGGHDRHGNFGG
jgi:hypothetical protein